MELLGKQSHARQRSRWEDNIKFDFMEINCEDGYWMNRAQWWVLVLVVFNRTVLLTTIYNNNNYTPETNLIKS